MPKQLTVYKVAVEQVRGKNRGKKHFLVVRTDNNGLLTIPIGYRLLYIVSELTSNTERKTI
jgi:hypothetical protein